MSANPRREESVSVTATSPTEALYFPRDAPRLFGWLHLPAAERPSDTGLVICKPFGYEALCGHRSMRAFAEMAAAVGMPALRFDYLGAGDSLGIDPDADQIETWCRDILTAVDELRSRTGVTRICLLGFRLGALLATLAAARSDSVDGLILVAPVISGPRYLREMRTTRLAALLGTGGAEASQSDDTGAVARAGTDSMEVSGHSVSAATVAALSRVDLSTLGAPRVSRMLLIDRDDLPTARAWLRVLSGSRAQADYATLPGFVKMMMTAPQFTLIPHDMISTTRDWLLRFAATETGNGSQHGARREQDSAPAAAPLLSIPGGEAGVVLTERPVRFGAGGVMFGIVTEPGSSERRRRAVVLLNTGADYHIGPGQLYVWLARRWARRGYVVLRLDLAGIGDSDTRPGMRDNEVFPSTALEDVRVAVEFMRERYQVGDVTLAGLCSGAYHSLRAAVAGLPVNRLLLVNPDNFFWDEGATLNDLNLGDVVRNPGLYRQRVFSLWAWKRVFTGQVKLWRIVQIYVRRPLLSVNSKLRDLARYLHVRLPRDLGRELAALGAQQVRMAFVFAKGEAGIDLLKIEAGSSIRRLGDYCHLHIIDGADHTFSRSSSRAVLEKILSDELFAP